MAKQKRDSFFASCFKPAAHPYTAGHVEFIEVPMCRLTLKQVELILHLFPLIRIGRGLFDLADRGPCFRELCIQFEVFLILIRKVVFGLYRVHGALRFAKRAVDAFIRVDDQHVRPLVETIDGAHFNAISVLALDARFGYYERHGIVKGRYFAELRL